MQSFVIDLKWTDMSVISPEDPKTLTGICQPFMVYNRDEDITVEMGWCWYDYIICMNGLLHMVACISIGKFVVDVTSLSVNS